MAATVIDALLVTLGLDASAFEKGQKDTDAALKKTEQHTTESTKRIEEGAKRTAEGFAKVKESILTVVAALIGAEGIKSFFTDITKEAVAITALSNTTGISTKVLQEYGLVMEKLGGSVGETYSEIERFEIMAQKIRTGQADDRTMNLLGFLNIDSNKFANETNAAKRYELAMQGLHKTYLINKADALSYGKELFGTNNTNQLNAIIQAFPNLHHLMEEEGPNTKTDRQLADLVKINQKWNELTASAKQFAVEIADAFHLENLLAQLEHGVEWLRQYPEQVELVVKVLGILGAIKFVGLITGFSNIGLILISVIGGVYLLYEALKLLNEYTSGNKLDILPEIKPLENLSDKFNKWTNGKFGMSIEEQKERKKRLDEKGIAGDVPNKMELAFNRMTDKLGELTKKFTGPTEHGTVSDGVVNKLSELIASKESGKFGYSAVHTKSGAKEVALEKMTIDQVLQAQKSGEFGAAGKYQMVPETLKQGATALGMKGSELYDAKAQEKLFTEFLLKSKRKEIDDYLSGKGDNLKAALIAFAQEWAAIEDPENKGHSKLTNSRTGELQKATISSAELGNILKQIRADNIAASKEGMSTSKTDVKIGTINVHTQATDAKGISQSIGNETRKAMTTSALVNHGQE